MSCIDAIGVHRCYLVARCQPNILSRLRGGLRKNEKLPTTSASAPCSTSVAKAASKSKRRTSNIMIFRSSARPAASISLFRSSKIGELEGPERYAIVVAWGLSSSKRLSCLPASSALRKVIPVTVPPGLLRLVTRPYRTGSSATAKTIGIVEVAAFAARAAYGEPVVMITSTLRSTSSAASRGKTDG